MSLIKCPECGKENVSDTAKICPDCGYKMNRDKLKSKRGILFIFIILALIIVSGIFVNSYIKQVPAKQAMNIISEDNPKYEIIFDKVYYNKEENTCVVYFIKDDTNDIGVVNLDTKEVGYRNLYEISAIGFYLATDEKQKAKIAEGIISDAYDPVYVNNVENGNEFWKLIYEK